MPLTAVLAALALAPSNPQDAETRNPSIILDRGFDTVIYEGEEARPSGLDPVLIAGEDRTLLIAFPGLRALPGNTQCVAATLNFHVLTGRPGLLTEARLIQMPWNGDAATATMRNAADKWQLPLGMGARDSMPLEGVATESIENGFAITGLQGAVQQMLNNRYTTYGLLFKFDQKVEMGSFELPDGMNPKLLIVREQTITPAATDWAIGVPGVVGEVKAGEANRRTWTLLVSNAGTGDLPATEVVVNGPKGEVARESIPALRAGSAHRWTMDLKDDVVPPGERLIVQLGRADDVAGNNQMALYPWAMSFEVPDAKARDFIQANEEILPTLRLSGLGKGSHGRIAPTEPLAEAANDPTEPRGAWMANEIAQNLAGETFLGGDTRSDAAVPPMYRRTPLGWDWPGESPLLLIRENPIPNAAALVLHTRNVKPVVTTMLFDIRDGLGQPVDNANVDLLMGETVVASQPTSTEGLAPIVAPEGENWASLAPLTVRVRKAGQIIDTDLQPERLYWEALTTGQRAVWLTMRVVVSDVGLDRTTNLAQFAPEIRELTLDPADPMRRGLPDDARIVDVIYDLSRDRLVSAIAFTGDAGLPMRMTVFSRRTGESGQGSPMLRIPWVRKLTSRVFAFRSASTRFLTVRMALEPGQTVPEVAVYAAGAP